MYNLLTISPEYTFSISKSNIKYNYNMILVSIMSKL